MFSWKKTRRRGAEDAEIRGEYLLEEATRLSDERTFSAAVNRALDHYVRQAKAGRILELAGRGLWEGNLSEMRGDRSARSNKHK